MKLVYKTLIGIAFLPVLLGNSGCEQSSYERERVKQESLSMQANDVVGIPAINNFAEKKMAKMIIETRDKMEPTITYTQDMNGKLHKLCDSQGYGLPFSTQYTNPQAYTKVLSSGTYAILPQPDPNGLFSPPSAEGTWVLCLNPKTQKMAPIYVEPRIIVSPFPLTSE